MQSTRFARQLTQLAYDLKQLPLLSDLTAIAQADDMVREEALKDIAAHGRVTFGTTPRLVIAPLLNQIQPLVLARHIDSFHTFCKEHASLLPSSLLQRIDHLEQTYNAYVLNTGNAPILALELLKAGSDAYASIMSFAESIPILTTPLLYLPPPESNKANLTLYFENESDLRRLASKLEAVEVLYSELAVLLDVDTTAHPLRVLKVETGSLLLTIAGSSVVLALVSVLIKRTAIFIHSNYTQEGKISRNVSLISANLQLTAELEKHGIDVSNNRDLLQKASILTAESIITLIGESPAIEVDSERIELIPEVAGVKVLTAPAPLLITDESPRSPNS